MLQAEEAEATMIQAYYDFMAYDAMEREANPQTKTTNNTKEGGRTMT